MFSFLSLLRIIKLSCQLLPNQVAQLAHWSGRDSTLPLSYYINVVLGNELVHAMHYTAPSCHITIHGQIKFKLYSLLPKLLLSLVLIIYSVQTCTNTMLPYTCIWKFKLLRLQLLKMRIESRSVNHSYTKIRVQFTKQIFLVPVVFTKISVTILKGVRLIHLYEVGVGGILIFSWVYSTSPYSILYFSLVVTIVTTSSIMGYVATDLEYECTVTIEAALSQYSCMFSCYGISLSVFIICV